MSSLSTTRAAAVTLDDEGSRLRRTLASTLAGMSTVLILVLPLISR